MRIIKLNIKVSLLLSSSIITSMASPALAQDLIEAPAPTAEATDANGVNIINGQMSHSHEPISVGDSANGLSASRTIRGSNYQDDMVSYISSAYPWGLTATYHGTTYKFKLQSPAIPNVYVTKEDLGALLIKNSGSYTFTLSDGTVLEFGNLSGGAGPIQGYGLTYAKEPSGRVVTYNYRSTTTDSGQVGMRLQSIDASSGYHTNISYQYDTISRASDLPKWKHIMGVEVRNNLADPCTSNVNLCPQPLPGYEQKYPGSFARTYSGAPYYTDADGATTWYTLNANGKVIGIKRPGNTGPNDTIIEYGAFIAGSAAVSSITRENGTTTYTYSDTGNERTVISTHNGLTRTYKIDIANESVIRLTNELQQTTSYEYDSNRQLTRITRPEQDYTVYQYDSRGNLTAKINYPKPGSGLAITTSTSSYPLACESRITCNKPASTTDKRGGVTEYTYDAVHGGVLTVTAPPPTIGAVRPQTRYFYTRLNSSGASDTNGIAMLASTSSCRTLGSCINTADEIRISYTYTRNLLVSSKTIASGDGALSVTENYTYDDIGNVIAIDGPLPGPADITREAYTRGRRISAVLSADPDGDGPLLQRATKFAYGPAGGVTQIQEGTASGLSETGLSTMTVLQSTDTLYDSYGRKIRESLTAGGATQGVKQYSYDAANRRECEVVRMNSATFGALPAACSASSASSVDADRITRYTAYDAADRPTEVTYAHGTTAASTERTAYTPNGQTQSVTDSNGNITTYEYDGFDRVFRTRFPLAGGGGSSTTDYKSFSFDSSGNVASVRLRDGQVLSYSYDALNRLIYADHPNTNIAEADVSYTYDNLGRMLHMSDQNGWFSAFEYDALGRMTRQSSNLSSNAMQYDMAGKLTRQTWADGFFVTYEHLLTGQVTAIRENGAFVLANYGYDYLGRQISINRGNGTVTSYGYDAASRLSSLVQDVAGADSDLSVSYAYNTAGQITQRTASNANYNWNGHVNINRPYAVNGLNQYNQSGALVPTYDARGNLTSAGPSSIYAYDTRNQLFTDNSGQLFYHNPAGLLSQVAAAGGVTNLDYVGSNLVSEFNGQTGRIARRYVYGPGTDEPLIWYEGEGAGDRRWLHADERGSVIAVSAADGSLLAINTYDEFGIPGSGNIGRFQYTGQKWIPELGMYDYKARMYSPTLGRFLQTDPVGYADGLNWYNYVGGDPINSVDPSGRTQDSAAPPADTLPIEVNGRRPPIARGSELPGGLGSTDWRDYSEAWNREPQSDQPDIVVTGIRCNATCQANLQEQNREKWPILNGRYVLNPFYSDPAPWLNLENFIIGPPLIGAVAAAAPVAAANVSVQGASKGYQLYGVGRVGQIRFATNRLIIRLDANKPITHMNFEGNLLGRSFNFHFPGW